MTIGLYMQELIRRVDPAHRTLGRFFQRRSPSPLGIEFYIGLPPEMPDERLARLRTFTAKRSLRALPHTAAGYVLRILWPWSLLRRSMLFADVDPNDRAWLEVEVPAGNGVGTEACDRPGDALGRVGVREDSRHCRRFSLLRRRVMPQAGFATCAPCQRLWGRHVRERYAPGSASGWSWRTSLVGQHAP